jgi:hypothetical protein
MRKKKEEALDVEGKAPQTNFHMSHRGKKKACCGGPYHIEASDI